MIRTNVLKIMEKKKQILENILLISFSVFLAFMTVYFSLRDHFIRSVIVLLIFIFLYYKYAVRRFVEANLKSLFYFSKLLKVGKINYTKDIIIFNWLIPSLILSISSIILVVLTGLYTLKANQFYGVVGPNFGHYILLAESFPSKIFLLIAISFLVLFLMQGIFIMKSSSIKKIRCFVASFLSTISTLLLMFVLIIAGILLYSFISVWILGGET